MPIASAPLLAVGLLCPAPAVGTPSLPAPAQDLTALSLEDLMELEVSVSLASRRDEPVLRAAAAVHVLTREDIRRSGATSIPEALRMVPGLQVARVDANRWAVSARGFNNQFANKLLVLIDGRTVYTQLFSGTFWDERGLPLEEVERIEVIRGPGAALWGANAVNGVINIITRDARETLGGHASAGVGDEEQLYGYVRRGLPLGEEGAVRGWLQGERHDSSASASGDDGGDAWSMARGGFRADRRVGERDELSLQAMVYSGDTDNILTQLMPAPPFVSTGVVDSDLEGGHVLGQWRHETGEGSSITLQAYYDSTERLLPIFGEERETLDLEATHAFVLGRHDVVWGLGYRRTEAELTHGSTFIALDPVERNDDLFTGFLQDTIALVPERWTLTLGARAEENDSTGFELQPNVRTAWYPDARQTVWAAVSRAVRTPSHFEQDGRALVGIDPGPPLTLLTLSGNPDLESEELIAHELGYRRRIGERLTVDLATFLHEYDELVTTEMGAPFFGPGGMLVVPLRPENRGSATARGAELAVEWAPRQDTRLVASYTLLDLDVDRDEGSSDPSAKEEGSAPRNQVHLGIHRDVGERWMLDAMGYYVDRLETGDVPAYTRLDLRVARRTPGGGLVELVVQGLFHDGEPEFGESFVGVLNEYEAGAYLRASWSF